MAAKFILSTFVIGLLAVVALSDVADGQDKKKRTGTVVGELKSRKDAPNKINVIVEILGAGEEKARRYRVAYDPKAKGPMPEVLKAVKEAAIGARVEAE